MISHEPNVITDREDILKINMLDDQITDLLWLLVGTGHESTKRVTSRLRIADIALLRTKQSKYRT